MSHIAEVYAKDLGVKIETIEYDANSDEAPCDCDLCLANESLDDQIQQGDRYAKVLEEIFSNEPSERSFLDPRRPASSFLSAGLQHMKDRASTYDNAQGERSMEKTVAAFNAAMGTELTSEQGWLFMSMLKLIRSQQGMFKADNYEDAAAYFALAGEQAFKDRT